MFTLLDKSSSLSWSVKMNISAPPKEHSFQQRWAMKNQKQRMLSLGEMCDGVYCMGPRQLGTSAKEVDEVTMNWHRLQKESILYDIIFE